MMLIIYESLISLSHTVFMVLFIQLSYINSFLLHPSRIYVETFVCVQSVPFRGHVAGGMRPGKKVVVMGVVDSCPDR